MPELELHTVCLILEILSLKKATKSLHDFLNSSSVGADDGGFVNSTTENKVRALLKFLLIISEKNACLLFQFVVIVVDTVFIKLVMNLEFGYSPPAFCLSADSFLDFARYSISVPFSFLTKLWSLSGRWSQ